MLVCGSAGACPPLGIFHARTTVASLGFIALSAAILDFSPVIHWRKGGLPAMASVTT
jgi:hypothetical protein